MQFRVNGLAGIARGLQLVAQTDDPQESGRNLATQAQRLVASDVVYADAFRPPAESVLEQRGVTNVAVPASVFVQNPEFASPPSGRRRCSASRRARRPADSAGTASPASESSRAARNSSAARTTRSSRAPTSPSSPGRELGREPGDPGQGDLIIRQDPQIRRSRRSTSSIRTRRRPCGSRLREPRVLGPDDPQVQVEPVEGENNTNNNTPSTRSSSRSPRSRLRLDVGSLRRRSLDRHRRRGGGGRGTDSLARLLSEAAGRPEGPARPHGHGQDDLVNFAVSLQTRIDDLHRVVDEVAAGLARIDRRVDGCLSHTALVRYNAYEDAGGHQSASLAFLDGARSRLS